MAGEMMTTSSPQTMHHEEHTELMDTHKMMHLLKEDFPEEIHDSKKYWKMGKLCEDQHMYESAKYFYAMSRDEYTHAKFIYEFLERHDVHVPENEVAEFEKIQEMMEKYFR